MGIFSAGVLFYFWSLFHKNIWMEAVVDGVVGEWMHSSCSKYGPGPAVRDRTAMEEYVAQNGRNDAGKGIRLHNRQS